MAKSQTQDATNKANSIYNQGQQQLQPVQQGLMSQTGIGAPAAPGSTSQFQGQTGQEAKAGFENMQTTGGYDPTQLQGLRSTSQGFTQTGGYDPNQLATLTGGYTDFAQTGGYDQAAKDRFLNQATSGVTSDYDVLQQQLQRRAAAQGGNVAGETAMMARNLAQDQANATLNAQTALDQQINANKLAGLGGLGTTAANVAGAREAGFGQQLGLEGGVAAGSRAGTQGLQGLYDTSTGQLTAQGNQLLQSMGLQFNTQEEAISFLTNLSKNPGLFGNIMQGIGAVGGANPVSFTHAF